MSANPETAKVQIASETQPLLGPEAPNYAATPAAPSSDVEDPIAARERAEIEAAAAIPDVNKKATWATIIWRIIITIFAGLGLALVIQAFRDSKDQDFDLAGALKKALGGGLSGAAAMVLQVATLMLRTIMNYQYRYGGAFLQAAKTLYADGGYGRYYRGVGAALIQGPVSRFGDTAANAGILALLNSNPILSKAPSLVKTVFASLAAASFRMILTPVDTLKTTLQTQGADGTRILRARIKMYGVGSLWYGAFATAAATFVGHYPWFATYNFLYANLPVAHNTFEKLLRQAVIGFCASVISDTVSNSLRVVKTYRQVNETRISYLNAAKAVIASDGLVGLFIRGLGTRILTNGLQSIMFSILWKLFMDLWDSKTKS